MASIDITRIAGNIQALNALNSLQGINNRLAVHQTRLATGKRLNEAADDPAGMTLATTFDVRRSGLKTALGGIGDAKNLMSTMEGGLTKVKDILVKMRNKALEAQSGTIGANEREAIKSQLEDFADEIDSIVKDTQWNGTNLISGGSGAGTTASVSFLTGAEATGSTTSFAFKAGSGTAGAGVIAANQGFQATAAVTGGVGLGLTKGTGAVLDVKDAATASTAVDAIDKAINVVKAGIGQVGSFTARLNFKEEALTLQHANTEAAYNRIMNANMAEEQVEASKYQILQQTGTAMLAQANQAPSAILSLFR
jgi:flagellin